MKIRTFDDYDDFRCLCGLCPDTCCAGWEVVVDASSREKYLHMGGALGQRLRETMEQTDGEYNFRLEDGRCPFLTGAGLCRIQAEAGEDALCETCRMFPRIPAEYGETREICLSVSCPEAARMLLARREPLRFAMRVCDAPVSEYSEIDGERYLFLCHMRARLIAEAQNRARPFPLRLARCLEMAADVQKALRSGADAYTALNAWDFNDPDGRSRDGERFSPPVPDVAANPGRTKLSRATAGAIYDRLLDHLDGLERLTARWGDMLLRMRQAARKPLLPMLPEEEYENLLVYYLFRYFGEAVYDGNAYLQVKQAAVSLCLIRLLFSAQETPPDARVRADLVHLYSREIENSPENLDALRRLLKDVHLGNRRRLLALILAGS